MLTRRSALLYILSLDKSYPTRQDAVSLGFIHSWRSTEIMTTETLPQAIPSRDIMTRMIHHLFDVIFFGEAVCLNNMPPMRSIDSVNRRSPRQHVGFFQKRGPCPVCCEMITALRGVAHTLVAWIHKTLWLLNLYLLYYGCWL